MTHKEKRTLAYKLATKKERTTKGKDIFDTVGWLKRAQEIRERVLRREARMKKHTPTP